MPKKKLAVKADEREPAWVKPWCRSHLDELEEYRGFVVIIHSGWGVISSARSMATLWTQARFLKKKLLPDIAYVYTSDVLPPLDDKREDDDEDDLGPVPEKTDPPPPLDHVPDPFDNDVVLDGASHPDLLTPGWPMIPSGSLGPHPSPHPQPPFTPRLPRPSNIRVDGVSRGPSRGIRYD